MRAKFVDILNEFERKDNFQDELGIGIGAEIARKMKESVNDWTYDSHETALHWSIANREMKYVKYLVSKGVDVNAYRFFSPIQVAVIVDRLDIVKYLVEVGGDIHYRKEEALMLAIEHDYFDIIEYLVSEGADLHIEREAYTHDYVPYMTKIDALLHAVEYGHLRIIEYLVDKGLSIMSNIDILIIRAISKKHINILEWLISNSKIDYISIKCLEYTIHNNKFDILDWLVVNNFIDNDMLYDKRISGLSKTHGKPQKFDNDYLVDLRNRVS